MSWAIERDKSGIPVRMWWMGQPPKRGPIVVPKTGCDKCGFHFGWHAMGCGAKQKGKGT